jgi:RNA polymerase sigma factor (sigma-70 family)
MSAVHAETDPGQLPVLTLVQHLLVRRALSLVDELAADEHERYRGLIELDDLRSAGKLALYSAAARFDEDFRVDFEQFARWHVYGAMIKAVRDEARHARVKRAARQTMARMLAYYTDDYDLVRDDDAELQRRLDKFCDNLAGVMFAGGIEEVTRRRPDVAYAEREEYARAIAMLQEVVSDLDEPEERMLTLLFREELTLHEVAERLGISYQAAWLRNTRLLRRLRDKLTSLGLAQAPVPIAARLPGAGPPELRLMNKSGANEDKP